MSFSTGVSLYVSGRGFGKKVSVGAGKREGYLKRDRREKFNLKRSWYVVAWRIVDKSGEDLIQPWLSTKGEAREVAKSTGITLIGETI